MEQRSPEWYAARCGSLGASQVHEALAKVKSGGWGAGRANIAAALVTERLTGQPAPNFVNDAMRYGIEQEPFARDAYARKIGLEIRECGLVRHPAIPLTHASPDGLVGLDGLVEIKVPNSATHIDTLLSGAIPQKYLFQMSWQMACCGRDWCDFVSFDPRLPAHMQLFVKRVERDDKLVLQLEDDVSAFLEEVDATVARLRAMYEPAAEAA